MPHGIQANAAPEARLGALWAIEWSEEERLTGKKSYCEL